MSDEYPGCVAVADEKAPGGFYLISEGDFDPEKHAVFTPGEAPTQKLPATSIDDAVAINTGSKKKK